MNTNNIYNNIKAINFIVCCVCIFLFLRIMFSNNINITGAKGVLFFAIAAPFLCWDHYRSFVNSNKYKDNESFVNTSEADDKYFKNLDTSSDETFEDAAIMLKNSAYDEVGEVLGEGENEYEEQDIEEEYSTEIEDEADEEEDYTYDEAYKETEETETERQAREIATRYSIPLEEAIDMLKDNTYDEVCKKLNAEEANFLAEEIAEKYSISVKEVNDMLARKTYDEVCEELDKKSSNTKKGRTIDI